ncbi:VCBS repeat-containing protein [uncultured Draconibacterium sp.]|uniref:FG-GAP repeat domain-containing protein n=1 Tax=uncultured Draconibacterium sp. TaxID=1573823 RepID=UPI0029C66ACD|nr:VCBS repeat-containing protein [uncultured Draconibacterium sp.]
MRNLKFLNLAIFIVFTFCSTAQKADDIRVKYNNPDLIVNLGTGLWGTPIPVDYDEDGLIDIIMSCPDTPYKGLYYYKNIGTVEDPLFDVSIKLADVAYKNIQASYAKGELHVFRKEIEYKNFKENIYSEPDTIKVDVLPKDDFQKVRSNLWSYVDFDNDGDLDLINGIDDWYEYGWDNAYDENGNWTNGPLRGFVYYIENQNGKYINKGKIQAGNQSLETYGAPGANMADFDNDGLADLICGEFVDKLTFFKNIGSASKPKFSEGQILKDTRGNSIRLHVQMITPTAIDFNKDGFIDLLVGDEDGSVAYLKNTGKTKNNTPVFEPMVYLKQKADNLKFGALSTPYSVDWDNDGDEDIICGNSAGNISFIENLSGGKNPKWNAPVLLKTKGKDIRILAGNNGSIQGPAEEKWGYMTLSVADWDNDGRKDIIANSIFGKVIWYKNTGDLINMEGPYSVKVDWDGKPLKPVWNWWNPGPTELVTQWRTTPCAIDWNNDGLNDLVMLDYEGYLSFYERFKKDDELWLKPGKRIFYENKEGNSELLQLTDGIAGRSGRRKLCLVDWNNDGRTDLIVNTNKGNAGYYENTRQKGNTAYFENKGNISDIILSGHTTSPTPIDWDKDGKYDILLGAEDGHFYFFKNKTIK